MALHRVRLYYSTADAAAYHDWLSSFLTNLQPWESDEVTNSVSDAPASPIDENDEDYYRVELAFDWSEDKAHILDNLSLYADSYCDWYRLGYHVCTHDEDDPTPCEFEELRENGAVPDHIPSLS